MHEQTPFLDPDLTLLWRGDRTLQVGLDPQRALALRGASRDLVRQLRSGAGRPSTEVSRVLRLLQAAGMLLDDDPRRRWAECWVEVVGHESVTGCVAEQLRAAGVGRVSLASDPTTRGPDLVVVAAVRGRGLSAGESLAGSPTVHLWAHLRDGRAVVGPLVVPGESSCLRCHDLHRTDADPAWPGLAVAWEHEPTPPPAASTVWLLASLVVRQCLLWLRGSRPATVDATLEEQPDGQLLRHRWPVHPACGCGWQRESAVDRAERLR